MQIRTAGAALAAVALCLAGCGGDNAIAVPAEINGNVLLQGPGSYTFTDTAKGCAGDGAFNDLIQGGDVTVTSAAGQVIGTGGLFAGVLLDSGDMCVFQFKVSTTSSSDFYGVAVGARPPVSFPAAEASSVRLTLGP